MSWSMPNSLKFKMLLSLAQSTGRVILDDVFEWLKRLRTTARNFSLPVREEKSARNTEKVNLKPYTNWSEFNDNLMHKETLVNFVMAYSRDAVLTQFGGNADIAVWNAMQTSDSAAYATALRAAGYAAILDGAFMSNDQGYNAIDFWLGGLAETAVPGGMLGSTFDFIFAMQMVKLQNADRFYYLNRLGGTNMLAEIEAQLPTGRVAHPQKNAPESPHVQEKLVGHAPPRSSEAVPAGAAATPPGRARLGGLSRRRASARRASF